MSARDIVPEAALGEVLSATSLILTCRCDGDSVRKGRFVALSSSEGWPPLIREADSGDRVFGVALKDGARGEYIPVCILGVVKVYAGGALMAGDAVKSDDEGRAVRALASDEGLSGGKSLVDAGGAGDQILILVCPDTHGMGT